MKFENIGVFNFENALRGMRNPKESWNKSDSSKIYWKGEWLISDEIRKKYFTHFGVNCNIGERDMELAQKLIKSGSEHRKFLRQIFVSVDITAPLYWWKEFDQYKIGVTTNSTSTMHKLAETSITLDCFEIDDYDKTAINSDEIDKLIQLLEELRLRYLKTNDNKYWKELVRWLPESWVQTRTVTMNYENLFGMCSKGQRRFHKLNEWSGKYDNGKSNFIAFAETLPYAKEFIFIDK